MPAEAARWLGLPTFFDRGKIYAALDRWRMVNGSSEQPHWTCGNVKINLLSREGRRGYGVSHMTHGAYTDKFPGP